MFLSDLLLSYLLNIKPLALTIWKWLIDKATYIMRAQFWCKHHWIEVHLQVSEEWDYYMLDHYRCIKCNKKLSSINEYFIGKK